MSLGLSEKVSSAVATYQSDVAMGQKLNNRSQSPERTSQTPGEDGIETVPKKKTNTRLGREYAATGTWPEDDERSNRKEWRASAALTSKS